MFHIGYLITFGIIILSNLVTARFCEEGGHRCSPPKECCAQGCCYLFAPPSVPRSPPPATDHVLNLFFINHWYFWCVVLAIILALLCACSLWKKRRQLCGWGSAGGPRSHSEGDSAGSCYAPPQYSRCSSFHHAPPPYTEVTSKPDLYPLVFTCNGDSGGKSGASYLMVQYFRNYIVRPVGSLSGTSTVDSLSSSFICTANEANILVPPPYSRAASPSEVPINTNTNGYLIPRSASQQICNLDIINDFRPNSVPNCIIGNNNQSTIIKKNNNNEIRLSESANFTNLTTNNKMTNSVILSQSDQQFRYNINTNNCNNNSGTINCDFITNNSNNNINNNNNTNHSNNNNNTNQVNAHHDSTNAIYNSCGSIGSISITMPTNNRQTRTTCATIDNERELDVLRQSLETCCQILQHHQMPSSSFSEESTINADVAKKYDGRSFVNSNTGSAVSSLANIGSPSSPPRATSPTDEVRELLDQINRLQSDSIDTNESIKSQYMPIEPRKNNTNPQQSTSNKRPSSLQSKKKLFSKTNKGLYIPISNANPKSIRSPIGSNSILCRGRGRRGWISRSAPTTPGSSLPPSRFEDDSPLLNEHDEDSEQNV